MTTEAEVPELTARLEASVLAVDGVDRLHPTLRRAVASVAAGAVHTVASGAAASAPPALQRLIRPGTPGLDVRRGRDDTVDVLIDLSTRPGSTALTVGRRVRQVVRQTVQECGLLPGRIAVTVLEVVAVR